MEKKINEAVCRYGMEKILEGAVVGFSGGADSSAVLHYLKDRCKNLLAVHINHMIRGDEALADEEHCRRICEKYGVELLVVRIDIPALSKERKKGLEETAREERYRVFYEILEKNPKYKCIVTAHNANDNGETVVFNLVRGSGANGLLGIKPVLGDVFRPLIYATREDIIKYCLDNNIEYVTDSTNSDTDYTRNNIRHNILPKLLDMNPNFLDSCTRLGEILKQDEEYICKEAAKLFALSADGKIPRKIAEDTHRAPLSRLLKMVSGENLDYGSVMSCISLIERWQAGKMVNIINGVTFKLEHDYCCFLKTKEILKKSFYAPLKNGVNIIENMAVCVGCDLTEDGYELKSEVCLNREKINGALLVRSKEDGDTVKSGGVTKKLKRIFADMHIPSQERSALPVICDRDGVLAVPGIVARDGAFNRRGDLKIKVYKKMK